MNKIEQPTARIRQFVDYLGGEIDKIGNTHGVPGNVIDMVKTALAGVVGLCCIMIAVYFIEITIIFFVGVLSVFVLFLIGTMVREMFE